MVRVTQALRERMAELGGDRVNCLDDQGVWKHARQMLLEKRITAAELERLCADTSARSKAPAGRKGSGTMTTEKKAPAATKATTTPSKKAAAVVAGKGAGRIEVKAPSAMYSTKRWSAKHAKTGMPVLFGGKEVEQLSELARAKMGALMKWRAARSGVPVVLSEHELGLVEEMFQKDRWVGGIGVDEEKQFSGLEAKALLSDSTSGGLYLNPIWFDDAIVTFPLLNGELFPFIDVRDMPRSNRIETGSLGNPTVTWGTAEGTAITAFTTTALAAQITSTVFPVQIAVEIGNDFLSDSAVDVGGYLTEVIGQRFLEELDGVVGTGDGTTQPQGLTNATGFAAVASDNSTSGPPTIGDYESLMFGIAKQYRRDDLAHGFVGNDVAYRRFCSIPVGPTDERRVGKPNMEHADYTALHRPFRVCQNFANSRIAYVALKKYRMWRRQGVESRWTTEGNYLGLRNLSLLVVRARFAGKLLDGAAMAMCTDAQA